jgi:serine/threonine-protein kinase RsbW
MVMETRRFLAKIEHLEEMLDYILMGLESLELTAKQKHQIRLVCEEALVNVIHYAYLTEGGLVTISYNVFMESQEVEIILEDEGVAFNPLESEDPDLEIDIQERKIGGLGIYMIKNIMDKVCYERVEGKNRLYLKKKF